MPPFTPRPPGKPVDAVDEFGSEFEDLLGTPEEPQSEFEDLLAPPPPSGELGLKGSEYLNMGKKLQEDRVVRKIILNTQLDKALEARGSVEHEKSFGESIADKIKVADVGRSETFDMRKKKFTDAYPEGELLEVPTEFGVVTMARKTDNEPFRQMPWGIMAAGSIDEGDVAGAAASMLTMGMGPVVGSLAVGAATAGGELVRDAIEEYRGYGDTSVTGAAFGAGGDAALGGGAEMLGRTLTRTNPAGPFVGEAIDVLKGQQRQNLLPLTRGQVSRYPLIRGLWSQAGMTSAVVKEKITAQQRDFLNSVKGRADDRVIGTLTDDKLEQLAKSQYAEMEGIAHVEDISRYDAGATLTDGIQFFKRATDRLVGRKYEKALKLGGARDIMWNIQPTKQIAARLRRGTLADPAIAGGAPVRGESPLRGELRSILDTIEAAHPGVAQFRAGGANHSGYEWLKKLRSRIGELKNSDNGELRQAGNELWNSLTDVMGKPLNANGEFAAAWNAANTAYKEQQHILKRNYAKLALTNDDPSKLAAKYYRPGSPEELAEIKTILNPHGATLRADGKTSETWEMFRQGFAADVLRDPDPAKRLAGFAQDPDSLKMLLTPDEERNLRRAATYATQMKNGPVQKALRRDLTEGERALLMIQKGHQRELEELVAREGGLDGDLAISMRAGIWQKLLDSSTSASETAFGADVLDPAKMLNAMRELKKTGGINALFRPDDWTTWEDFKKYAVVVGQKGDVGGGMQAAGVRAAMGRAVMMAAEGNFGGLWRSLIRPVFSNELSARFLAKGMKASTLERRLEQSKSGLAHTIKSASVGAALALKDLYAYNFLTEFEPETMDEFAPVPEPLEPAPPPAPGFGDQGSLLPPPPGRGIPPQRQAAAPPLPGPIAQPPAQQPNAASQGQRYSMMFPGDSIGAGIASLR